MTAPIPIPDQFAVSIGEILWDSVGDEQHMGGAPLNFAYHCRALGVKSAIISAIANDDAGACLLNQANSLGIDTTSAQRHNHCPTGVVQAVDSGDGTITYTFPADCPWDHIHFTEQARDLVDQAHILNFGTLAQRSATSRAAIMAALSSAPARTMRFLDLNLRVPYYDRDAIHRSLEVADVVKLNEWELAEVKNLLHIGGNEDFALMGLLDKYDLSVIVVTLGPGGAYGISRSESVRVDGYNVDVADTIGCGDAFSAALAVKLVEGATLNDALETANATGGYVATQPGGAPRYSAADIVRFRDNHPKPLREGANLEV